MKVIWRDADLKTHEIDLSNSVDVKIDANCVHALLVLHWNNLDKLPDNISFRCLIKFKEHGINGNKHISTGYWWHRQNGFTVDSEEMTGLTPCEFIQL